MKIRRTWVWGNVVSSAVRGGLKGLNDEGGVKMEYPEFQQWFFKKNKGSMLKKVEALVGVKKKVKA